MTTPEVTVHGGDGWEVVDGATIRGRARVDPSVRADLEEAAASGDLDAVIDVLAGAGIRAMPDFAFVALTDPARVVARGSGSVVVESDEGPRTIAHTGRGPWLDEDVTTPGSLRIGEPPAPVAAGSDALGANADAAPSPDASGGPAVADAAPATGWARPKRFGRRATDAAIAARATAVEVPAEAASPAAATPETPDPAPTAPPAPSVPEMPARAHAEAEVVPPSVGVGGGSEEDELPSYDHLFGATQHALPTEIERADEPHPDQHEAPAPESDPLPPMPRAPELTMPAPPEDEPAPAAQPVVPPATGGLIASVPWLTGGTATPASAPATTSPTPARPAPPRPAPVSRPAPAPPPYAPAPAPVSRPAPAASAPPAPSPTLAPPAPTSAPTPAPPAPTPPAFAPAPTAAPAPGTPGIDGPRVPRAVGDSQPMPPQPDPDEATVDRRSLQQPPTAEGGPLVLSVLCPAGHASSPHSSHCRVCQREIPAQQPFMTPRPSLGTLRLSTGDVVSLDRGVLFGRQPKVNDDVKVSDRPHVVRLASPDKDISRNHVEVLLDGWHVLVRDLGSINGTTVALPGEEPVRLRPSDQQNIEPGTVVGIADTVTFSYEVDA